MRRRSEISPLAQRRLGAIEDWTREQFGYRQAVRYLDLIEQRLSAVAEGTAHMRPLDLVTGKPAHAVYSAARAGEHFLILSVTPDRVRLIDIVHGRSDIAAHLHASLPKDP